MYLVKRKVWECVIAAGITTNGVTAAALCRILTKKEM